MERSSSKMWLGVLLAAGLALAACSGGGGSDSPPATRDTDGDGLTDADETSIHGTNPQVADTDGDGWSDFEEIVTMAFNPDPVNGNPYSFNPLVADVPKVGIAVTSPPSVDVTYTTAAGTTKTVGTSTTRTQESASTVTTTEASSSTSAVETMYAESVRETNINGSTSAGGCTTVEAGGGGSVDLGLFELGGDASASSETCFEAHLSFSYSENMEERSYSESTTSSSTVSWSASQAKENRQAFSEAESYEQANSSQLAQTGGTVAVTVNASNLGEMTFVPSNVVLSALLFDPRSARKFVPIGNLTFDGSSFPANALAPGESATGLVFKNSTLALGPVKRILADPRGLVVKVATYDVLDETGVSFRFDQTVIDKRTATIVIDYAGRGGLRSERYMVATDTVPGSPGVLLGDVLSGHLRIPYEAGTVAAAWNGIDLTGLTKVRSVGVNPAARGYWLVIHEYFDSTQMKRVVKAYNSLVRPFDFDAIRIYAKQTVYLLYVEDKDHDGLYSREETLHGSSDLVADTDGDGLTDYEEVTMGWIDAFSLTTVYSTPASADIDRDGLRDDQERVKQTDPWNPNTDGDGLNDAEDPEPAVADLSLPTVPALVTATGASASQINVGWAASTDSGGVSHYEVYEGATLLGTTATTSYAHTGLAEYSEHCYGIAAVDTTANKSAKSSPVCARTRDVTAPSAPAAFDAVTSATTAYSVDLSWRAATDNSGAVTYEVLRQISTGWLVIASGLTSTSYTDGGRAPETQYCYAVAAVDGALNRTIASTGNQCATTGPVAPTNGTATWSSLGYFIVSCTDQSTVETGFEFQRSRYSCSSTPKGMLCLWTIYADAGTRPAQAGTGGVVSQKDTTAASTDTWRWRVRAVNANGPSAWVVTNTFSPM